jgi:hypothetical protein
MEGGMKKHGGKRESTFVGPKQMTVADGKREPIRRVQPLGNLVSTVKTPGTFGCMECGHHFLDENIGVQMGMKKGGSAILCKSCFEKAERNAKKPDEKRRAASKHAVKHYKSGKLPKWMFS